MESSGKDLNISDYPYVKVCPSCNSELPYWRSSGMSQMFPHFYCNRCSNVFRREEDYDLVMRAESLDEEVLQTILDRLPGCPCGGQFAADANPKCPHCGFEFKHSKTALERLTDPHVIKLKGYKLITE